MSDHKTIGELTTVRWRESSGVDHSANEEEGWLIMKERGQDTESQLTEFVKREEEITQDARTLFEALAKMDKHLGDAPSEIQRAVDRIGAYLGDEFADLDFNKKLHDEDEDERQREREEREKKGGKGGVKKYLERFLKGLGITQIVEDALVEKALEKAWPAFIKAVAELVRSDDAPEEKQEKVIKLVADLKSKVAEVA